MTRREAKRWAIRLAAEYIDRGIPAADGYDEDWSVEDDAKIGAALRELADRLRERWERLA